VLVNGGSAPITVAPGASVTVTVAGGPALPRDWVGKALSTAPNNSHFSDWKYLNGTQTPPTTGQPSATLTFVMPTTPGTYVFRFFQNDQYVLLATSPIVTVSGGATPTATPTTAPTATPAPSATPTATPTGQPTAVPTATPTTVPSATPTATPAPSGASVLVNGSASPVTVIPGATVTVAVAGGPGGITDWVAKHDAAAPNTTYYPDWKYLSGTQTAPATGKTSATLTFTMPTTPGTYNFRFFANNGFTLLATSPTVTVP
jgi:hypothetical protein